MIIEKINNSIVFNKDNEKHIYPLNAIFLIANDDSNSINVRLRASRKNVLTFNYNEVTNLTAESATEMVELISMLSNK
jgi:hypothetical protein